MDGGRSGLSGRGQKGRWLGSLEPGEDGLMEIVEDITALAGAGLDDGEEALDEALATFGLGSTGGASPADEVPQALLGGVVGRLGTNPKKMPKVPPRGGHEAL